MDKKKLIYILTGIMGGIIVIIGIIALISSLTSNKTLSYEKIEVELEKAAISYFESNSSSLPTKEGASTTVEASTLTSGGHMKELSEMVKEGVSCSAKVIVTKNGDNYLYSPILNCGDKYGVSKLVDVVMKNNSVVTEKDGLYKDEDIYVFRGEYVNNYVSIDGKLWRIIDIDSEGYARLIYTDKNTEDSFVWDDRYNVDVEEKVGINNYEVSRIYETLNSEEFISGYISDSVKPNLAYKSWCVGKRSSTNVSINNDEECVETVSNQLFGLPYVSDYFNASIDSNCNTIDDESCDNYNYLLNMSLSSWTLTGSKEKSHRVYIVSSSGYAITNASNEKKIRPTVYLSNNSLYDSGDGSKTNPYIIK